MIFFCRKMNARSDRLAKEWMTCTMAMGFVVLLACTASKAAMHQQTFHAGRVYVDTELALLPFTCDPTPAKLALATTVDNGPVTAPWRARVEARIQHFEAALTDLTEHRGDPKALEIWPCLRSQKLNL